jgi:hypothetical protein
VEGVKGEATSYTCGTSEVRHVHSQCMTKYLGWQIVSIVWADSDITIAALIEAIKCLTKYRVSYGKAWRAKEHALTLLWGGWKEAYAKVPRLLHAIVHCRPIISVDGTFLTGKYKGTLIVAVGMTAKNQLLPLLFALVESENNESWK